MRSSSRVLLLAACLVATLASAAATGGSDWNPKTSKCPKETEMHKVHVPYNSMCSDTKQDTCDISEVIVDIKKDTVIIRFELEGVMDSTKKKMDDPGKDASVMCKKHPGSSGAWPMKGVTSCPDDDEDIVITIDIKGFKGCGYRFLVCSTTPNNSWMKGIKDADKSGCCVTVTIPPTPGSVCQDPHFTGFDGVKYDFHGIDDKVFNVISSPNTQLNALFSPAQVVAGQSFMTQMGFKNQANDLILVKATDFGKLEVNMNGEVLASLPEGAELKLRSDTTVAMQQHGLGNGQTLIITTADLRIRIFSPALEHSGEITIVHLNLAVEVLNAAISMHGVLGQTYGKAGNTATSVTNESAVVSGYADYHTEIQGKAEDYVVSDLFSNDFVYNMFAAPSLTVQESARRALRA